MSTDRLIAELIGTYGIFTVVPFSVQAPAAVPLARVANDKVVAVAEAAAVYD